MVSTALAFPILFAASVAAAQSSSSVVCVAGQCLQGVSNTTIGATVSAPGAAASLLLLPGQYTSTTNPQLLHNVLTTSSASLSPSAGFANSSSSSSSSISLPLNVALQPGVAAYSSSLYSGQVSFSQLPTSPISNTSTPLSVGSLSLSSDVWIAVNTGSNNRVIFWDSIPDFTQLPTGTANSLSLVDMQSAACSPPCAGSGVCSASGSCICPTGFNGTSCESCSPGFFGPTCHACPSGCTSCDDGISGSGRCLTPTVNNLPSSCNCLNGECGSNGQCTCLSGWTTAANGTACAQCATGFFLASNGNCQVCELGCTQCADSSGDCITCKTGFTQDSNDRTKCDAAPQTASNGAVCPDGSFSSSGTCQPCSPLCQTCTAGTSNDCVICGSGTVAFGGSCVATNGNGVCEGSNLIANNNNHECDSCGPKCTTCQIPNFNVASTIDKAQCTGCLPGFVLSQGKCVSSCPSGTFLSPQDNLTCTACDASCSSCAGSSTFCLTCANNQLASNGKCVSTCPTTTFSSSGVCITCHPDCSTCSGSSFNQCSSCPSSLPVLTNGRCLPTCSKSQFFDKTSSTCQACDASCSSCSGSGSGSCLACANEGNVLRAGSCVAATCNSASSVVPGLGVCLSDLVVVPQPSGTGTATAAFPTITGLNSPIVTSTRRPLEWWEILLMALGCAFIFLVVLMCWRRRARKIRAKQTAVFASAKLGRRRGNWLVRFGEKLFGHGPPPPQSRQVVDYDEPEEIKLMKLRAAEEARHDSEIEKLIGAYEYSRAGSHRVPSRDSRAHSDNSNHSNRLSGGSLYSQVTGMPRRTAEPRQPVKNGNVVGSRFSNTTFGTSSSSSLRKERELTPPLPVTDAEVYAASVRRSPEPRGTYWITPTNTGGSKNPFIRPLE